MPEGKNLSKLIAQDQQD